jgi:hypothetical protein
MGVNIFNRTDPFFNDICFSYSENGADMIIKDRLAYIYQNYTICDKSCIYQKTDIKQRRFSCNCILSSSFESNLNDLNSFISEEIKFKPLANTSISVIKCYKLVFNFKNKLNNIGFWLHLIIIIFHIPIYVIYSIFGVVPLQRYIKNEMEKNHYLIQSDEKNKNRQDKKRTIRNNDNNKEKNREKKDDVIDENNNEKIITNKNIKIINNLNTQIDINSEQNKIKNQTSKKLKIFDKTKVKNKRKLNKNSNIINENTQKSNNMKSSYSKDELIVDQLNTSKEDKTKKINEVIN